MIFAVKDKNSNEEFVVYQIRANDFFGENDFMGLTEFLIWDNEWVWKNANNFIPIEN